ncbi:hypothetical protein [Corallococcus sp. EGB]|uniref:hypothetical protein n=1 Tax=Corallococcus sp. EGB TaxID=1521117 RepID=UPI001CC0FB07|nr:hypothetical protein [Corallococcus sp. EGB]
MIQKPEVRSVDANGQATWSGVAGVGFRLLPGERNVQRYPVNVVLNGNANKPETVAGPTFDTHGTLITSVQVVGGQTGDEWFLAMMPTEADKSLPAHRTNRDGFLALGTREPHVLFDLDTDDDDTRKLMKSDDAGTLGNNFVYIDTGYTQRPRLGTGSEGGPDAEKAAAFLGYAFDLRGFSHVLFTVESVCTADYSDDPQTAIIPAVDLCAAPGLLARTFRTVKAGTAGNVGGAGVSPAPLAPVVYGGKARRSASILLGAAESSQSLADTDRAGPLFPAAKFRLITSNPWGKDAGGGNIWDSAWRMRLTAQAW